MSTHGLIFKTEHIIAVEFSAEKLNDCVFSNHHHPSPAEILIALTYQEAQLNYIPGFIVVVETWLSIDSSFMLNAYSLIFILIFNQSDTFGILILLKSPLKSEQKK